MSSGRGTDFPGRCATCVLLFMCLAIDALDLVSRQDSPSWTALRGQPWPKSALATRGRFLPMVVSSCFTILKGELDRGSRNGLLLLRPCLGGLADPAPTTGERPGRALVQVDPGLA